MVDVTWAEFDDGLEFVLWSDSQPVLRVSVADACDLRDELEDAIEQALRPREVLRG